MSSCNKPATHKLKTKNALYKQAEKSVLRVWQSIWQQLQAAQAAQAERLRSGRAYDVALGDADVSADVGADSAGFPKPPRDFRPPPGLGEIAVRTAHARLRAVQSRWSLEPQQQWFKVCRPCVARIPVQDTLNHSILFLLSKVPGGKPKP